MLATVPRTAVPKWHEPISCSRYRVQWEMSEEKYMIINYALRKVSTLAGID